MARSHPAADAAAELIKLVSREHRVIDDTSIIVLDMLPSSSVTYPEVVEAQRAALGATSTQKKSSSGFFSCFRPEVDVPDSRDILGHGHLPLYAEADGLKVCGIALRNARITLFMIPWTLRLLTMLLKSILVH